MAGRTVNVEGRELPNGIILYGDAHEQPDGKWRCLANVGGALCVVEVKVTFDDDKPKADNAWVPTAPDKPDHLAVHTEWTITVGFVDTTYWDDNSRWTSRTFGFKDEFQMKLRKAELLKRGVVEYIGNSGENATARIDWLRVATITTQEETFDLS